MRNFFVLVWLNQINVLSAKLRSNPSSIYIFPAKYPLFFGNIIVLSWLRDNNIIVESLKVEDMIFGKFDVGDYFLLESYFIAWEVLYLFTKRSKAYALPSGVHY